MGRRGTAASGHLWHLDRYPGARAASRVSNDAGSNHSTAFRTARPCSREPIMTDQPAPLDRHLHELARHMAWADAMVWNAVLSTPQAATDHRIADTLHHIHLVQHIFLQAWRGSAFAVR